MSDNITWGREIAVNGVRPAWLSKDTYFRWYGGSIGDNWWDRQFRDGVNGISFQWGKGVDAIRLPVNHFVYTVLDYNDAHANEEPFHPWGGGDGAPDDWDGGDVLRRGGAGTHRPKPYVAPYSRNQRWTHRPEKSFADIIGYRKRTEMPADTVMIARMTEDEAIARFRYAEYGNAVLVLRSLNLIREETTAERFTRETGHQITPAVEAALNWKHGA